MMKLQSNCVPVQPGLFSTCRKPYDRFHVTNNYLFKYLYAERERERVREREYFHCFFSCCRRVKPCFSNFKGMDSEPHKTPYVYVKYHHKFISGTRECISGLLRKIFVFKVGKPSFFPSSE